MAGSWIGILVLCVAYADATPHRSEDCEEGSLALKEFLNRHDEWFHMLRLGNVTFDYAYEGLTGSTLAEFPDDILCQFSGSTNLDDLFWRLYTTGYLRMIFDYVYNYATTWSLYGHQIVLNNIQNPPSYANVTELVIYEQLFADLEASGILSLNPGGFLWFRSLLELRFDPAIMNPQAPSELPEFYPTDEDMSTENIYVQAKLITNDIRKLWNMVIQQAAQHEPDAGQHYRDKIEQWTGIHLEQGAAAHNTVQNVVWVTLECLQEEEPLFTLFELSVHSGVSYSAFMAAYNVYVPDIYITENMIEQEPSEIMELLDQFIQAVRRMGLFDLQ